MLLHFTPEAVRTTYEISGLNSPLRRYFCPLYVFMLFTQEVDCMTEMSESLREHSDFALDVVKLLAETKGNVPDPDTSPNCHFRSHDKDTTCPLKAGVDS